MADKKFIRIDDLKKWMKKMQMKDNSGVEFVYCAEFDFNVGNHDLPIYVFDNFAKTMEEEKPKGIKPINESAVVTEKAWEQLRAIVEKPKECGYEKPKPEKCECRPFNDDVFLAYKQGYEVGKGEITCDERKKKWVSDVSSLKSVCSICGVERGHSWWCDFFKPKPEDCEGCRWLPYKSPDYAHCEYCRRQYPSLRDDNWEATQTKPKLPEKLDSGDYLSEDFDEKLITVINDLITYTGLKKR